MIKVRVHQGYPNSYLEEKEQRIPAVPLYVIAPELAATTSFSLEKKLEVLIGLYKTSETYIKDVVITPDEIVSFTGVIKHYYADYENWEEVMDELSLQTDYCLYFLNLKYPVINLKENF